MCQLVLSKKLDDDDGDDDDDVNQHSAQNRVSLVNLRANLRFVP